MFLPYTYSQISNSLPKLRRLFISPLCIACLFQIYLTISTIRKSEWVFLSSSRGFKASQIAPNNKMGSNIMKDKVKKKWKWKKVKMMKLSPYYNLINLDELFLLRMSLLYFLVTISVGKSWSWDEVVFLYGTHCPVDTLDVHLEILGYTMLCSTLPC